MMEVKLLMLLPTKGIEPERALLTIGARIVSLLESPATITGLWERFLECSREDRADFGISFDWFALAITMLFAINVVAWDENGQLVRYCVSA